MKSSSEAGSFVGFEADPAAARGFSALAQRPAARFEPAAGPPPPDPERLRAEAFEAGRAAGRGELPWSEAEALQSASRALAAAAERLEAQRRDAVRTQRETALELALVIAEAIVGRELASDPRALLPRLEAALVELPAGEPVRVRLAPTDHAVLAAGKGALLAELGALAPEPDPALAPGDAWLCSGASRVDARLATLLERVRAALESAVAADPVEPADLADPADPEEAS